MVTPVLSAESIHKSFGRRKVLASASLWATPGRITALLGANGSGKTTLLKVAAGWLAADHGTVIFKGQAFERPRLPALANMGLFYLPDRDLLSFTVTLRRHLAALKHAFPTARVEEAAELLDIDHLMDRKPKTFSGGERRRAAMTVALARDPDVLLADEAFLDAEPSDAGPLAAAFRALADRDCAVVVAGQEVRDLLDLVDEVAWMRAGTTEQLGPPERAREDADFRREYLGERN
jgi:ABC-type multidrug transport system ATPase subunit